MPILSTLAQRDSELQAPARDALKAAVEFFTASRSVSILGPTLASNPNLAWAVVPELLRSDNPEARAAAFEVLRDLDSTQAIDLLVRELAGDRPIEVRGQAARAIATAWGAGGGESDHLLVQNQGLEEVQVPWPYAHEMEPAVARALAAPIGRTLSDYDIALARTNPAVLCAALYARGGGKHPSRRTALQWRFAEGLRALVRCSSVVSIAWAGVVLVAAILALTMDRDTAVSFAGGKPVVFPVPELTELWPSAEALRAHLEQAYPPNAEGLGRVLPWNWDVEPALGAPGEATYSALAAAHKSIRVTSILERLETLVGLPSEVPPPLAQAVRRNASGALERLHSRRAEFVVGSPLLSITAILCCGAGFVMLITNRRSSMRNPPGDLGFLLTTRISSYTDQLMPQGAIVGATLLAAGGLVRGQAIVLSLLGAFVGLSVLAAVVQRESRFFPRDSAATAEAAADWLQDWLRHASDR